MKICGISDMHGNLGFEIKPCEILCICGDIVPLDIQKHNKATLEWLSNKFVPWCEKQPCEIIFLIAGNHDFIAMDDPDGWEKMFEGSKVKYLLDSGAEYKGFKIYGTPWCHQFYNWAFMTSDDKLAKIYSKIPSNTDILLTHDAPYGTSDVILQDVWWSDGKHIGCKPLSDAVAEKCPVLMLHGHLHSTNHELEMAGETKVYNVSLLDENYKMSYKPLYLELVN